jgi:3-dehydroquinate synthase
MAARLKKVRVELGERSYDIMLGEDVFASASKILSPLVKKRKCLIVSDGSVYSLYADRAVDCLVKAGAFVYASVFKAGEESKNISVMERLFRKAAGTGLDRDSFIVALGGGVPGDMAGFLAATYMRGINFIQIPTSLLAMVDSSVGGKTGFDLPEGKNLIGAFWQPKKVLIDPKFLETLPDRELLCGMAEIVKTAVILDAELFSFLEERGDEMLDRKIATSIKAIARCCELKASVVSADEREGGLRAILNYGHTFGHAIETVSGYSSIAHGEAVSVGMCMAADLAVRMGVMSKGDAKRQESLLENLSLPCRVSGLKPAEIVDAMSKDKKTRGDKLNFVLATKIGSAKVFKDVPREIVAQTVRGRCD